MPSERLVFGSIPSRRLGRSLGVNNVPHKVCSYSCVYCQLGRTIRKTIRRRVFYDPMEIYRQVLRKLTKLEAKGLKIDYLTFVASGETYFGYQY